MDKAILVDTTKCTACRACQVACKQWNQNPAVKTTNRGSYENPPTLGSYTWMRILFNEKYEDGKMNWYFTKHQCMHCNDAACVEVCPPKATTYKEYKIKGDSSVLKIVETDPDKCIGCNYCRVACPFDVPGYNQKEKGIFRCTLCVDRITNPEEMKEKTDGVYGTIDTYPEEDNDVFASAHFQNKPACVKACAPGALEFGDREEMLKLADARLSELQEMKDEKGGALYPKAQVYGNNQLGGLHYIYVLADDPEEYGLPKDPSIPIGTKIWKALAKPYGAFAAGGLVLALVINGVINARNRGLEAKYKVEE